MANWWDSLPDAASDQPPASPVASGNWWDNLPDAPITPQQTPQSRKNEAREKYRQIYNSDRSYLGKLASEQYDALGEAATSLGKTAANTAQYARDLVLGKKPEPRPLMPTDDSIARDLTTADRTANQRVPMEGEEAERRRPMAERIAARRDEIANDQAKYDDQRAFEDSRTALTRVGDTAAFVGSILPRGLTRGEYGVAPEAEERFHRANPEIVSALKTAGDVGLGIPMLRSMGNVEGGVSASINALANRPVSQARAANVTRAATQIDERLADVAAMERTGVTPRGYLLTDAGVGGLVKQVSEAPIVGAPMRNAIAQSFDEIAQAGERTAGQYGTARTFRDAGNVAEQALDRFRDARSADTVGNRAAQMTDAELRQVSTTPVRETSIRTKQDALYERAWRGLPQDMREGRSRDGITRFMSGLTETRSVINELVDRNLSMVRQTRMEDGRRIAIPVEERRVGYPIRGGLLGQSVQDLIETTATRSLQDVRNMRSEFRRLASGMADTERNTLNLSDMQRIQGAFTRDMIGILESNVQGYRQAAASGVVQTRRGATRNLTAVEQAQLNQQAASIERSIRDFRRADQFTRASAQRLETLEKMYGAQSAEQLALGVFKDTMGGRKGGNMERLQALKQSLRPDEWGDMSAGILREMGRPVGSAIGPAQEAGFSVRTFMTNWNNMSPEARQTLFRTGRNAELSSALDDFVRTVNRLSDFEALANTSRSATNGMGVAGLVSILAAVQQAFAGNLGSAAMAGTVGGGMWGLSKFMASPWYVSWLTRAARLSQDTQQYGALSAHVRMLMRRASNEPMPDVQQFATALGTAINNATSNPDATRATTQTQEYRLPRP